MIDCTEPHVYPVLTDLLTMVQGFNRQLTVAKQEDATGRRLPGSAALRCRIRGPRRTFPLPSMSRCESRRNHHFPGAESRVYLDETHLAAVAGPGDARRPGFAP